MNFFARWDVDIFVQAIEQELKMKVWKKDLESV